MDHKLFLFLIVWCLENNMMVVSRAPDGFRELREAYGHSQMRVGGIKRNKNEHHENFYDSCEHRVIWSKHI